MALREARIGVKGMSCASCSSRVEKVIRATVDGIDQVEVNLEGNVALVRYDERRTDLGRIAEAVEKAGFRAVLPGE